MRIHDLAAEGIIARINIGGDGWIAGSYVLRRNQQPLGSVWAQTHDCAARESGAAQQNASSLPGDKTEKAQTIFQSRAGQCAGLLNFLPLLVSAAGQP